jgi:hypothetical protein
MNNGKNNQLHIKYICNLLDNIICNNLWYSYCQLHTAVGLWQDCIVQSNFCMVFYYIDQFQIQFHWVWITDLWNMNYVNVNVNFSISNVNSNLSKRKFLARAHARTRARARAHTHTHTHTHTQPLVQTSVNAPMGAACGKKQ